MIAARSGVTGLSTATSGVTSGATTAVVHKNSKNPLTKDSETTYRAHVTPLLPAPTALLCLAARYDSLAAGALQRPLRDRYSRAGAQLRAVAEQAVSGALTVAEAWIWADAGAGQLATNRDQLQLLADRTERIHA